MTDTATTQRPIFRVLQLDSSGRVEGSTTRSLTHDIVAALEATQGNVEVSHRDLANGVDFVDSAWIDANFTARDERTEAQREALKFSDTLVAEIQSADAIVIGVPIYNFGIPATLKAWIDMVARAGVTFRYSSNGPEGLLKNKKVYIAIASGGVAIDSAADFATPYMRHALNFIGIQDIEVFGAEQLNSRGEDALVMTRARIANLVAAPLTLPSVAA